MDWVIKFVLLRSLFLFFFSLSLSIQIGLCYIQLKIIIKHNSIPSTFVWPLFTCEEIKNVALKFFPFCLYNLTVKYCSLLYYTIIVLCRCNYYYCITWCNYGYCAAAQFMHMLASKIIRLRHVFYITHHTHTHWNETTSVLLHP